MYPPYNNFKSIVVTANIYPDGSLTHAVYIGTAGSFTVVDQAGNAQAFVTAQNGVILPIAIKSCSAVNAANDMVALRRI